MSDENSSLIEEILKELHKSEVLKSYGLYPVDRLLFCGPPGCGKTLTAEVVASELGLPFSIVRIDSVVSSYLGETASNLRQVFDFISSISMVVLFDEFDALGKERDDASDHGELKRVVNAFIQMLDGYGGKSLLIAATNHDHILDSAVWRRFDEVLIFDLPNIEHLRRLISITEKRPGGRPYFVPPADPSAHGRRLQERLKSAIEQTDEDVGGFDDRRLFRFTVTKGFDPDTLKNISHEIEFVSQEGDEIVVAFVSTAALESFEARLTSLAKGERVKYKQVLYALQGFDRWSPKDRTGWALDHEGFPDQEPFVLDLELWPIEDHQDEREKLLATFETWLNKNNMEIIDSVKQPGLSLFRVRCNRQQADFILQHRDIRSVDLPPKYGLDLRLLRPDIEDFPEILPPPENAPGLVILDSGLTTGHPFLAPAVGDSQSFLPGKDATDEHGHGTLVAGLGLYGDIETAIQTGELTPRLRIFSGRILDENNENTTGFVENQIDEAVRYFHESYGCMIFNLSFGDFRKPYFGGHLKGLSYILDTLYRELG
ncbi:MAG: AAA family ATPase, partial [Desulfobacterales bacterium]